MMKGDLTNPITQRQTLVKGQKITMQKKQEKDMALNLLDSLR